MLSPYFLPWITEQPEAGRRELFWAEVVTRPDHGPEHEQAKAHIAARLTEALANTRAHVHTDGPFLPINDMMVWAPDVLVRFGAPLPDGALHCDDPVLIVEILPAGTPRKDMQERAEFYFEIASLRHFLIVRINDPVVIYHLRDKDDIIQAHMIRDDSLRLDDPDVALGDLRWPPR